MSVKLLIVSKELADRISSRESVEGVNGNFGVLGESSLLGVEWDTEQMRDGSSVGDLGE